MTKGRIMGFSMVTGNYHQTVDDGITAGYEDEILLFGRAIEIIDIELAQQHQLNLPFSNRIEAAGKET
jgi:hypothetical protein